MSNNKHRIRDQRLGGMAGDGMPISDVVRIAIANSTRADHQIDTRAPQFGDALPVALHTGEVPASEIATRLQGQDKEAADTR